MPSPSADNAQSFVNCLLCSADNTQLTIKNLLSHVDNAQLTIRSPSSAVGTRRSAIDRLLCGGGNRLRASRAGQVVDPRALLAQGGSLDAVLRLGQKRQPAILWHRHSANHARRPCHAATYSRCGSDPTVRTGSKRQPLRACSR